MANKKIIKILILLSMVLAFAINCFAETTTITYEEDENTYGINFKDNNIVDEYKADILFLGLDDKQEGYELPSLYADNPDGGILLNKENKKCSELEGISTNKEEEIVVGNNYCIITRNAERYVSLEVIDLSDSWSNITIEWEILDEIREIKEEVVEEELEIAEEVEEILEIEQTEELRFSKQDIDSGIAIVLSFVIIVLTLLIVITMIKIRKYS